MNIHEYTDLDGIFGSCKAIVCLVLVVFSHVFFFF